MKIVTTAQMRQVEEECAGIGIPPSVLMENAGKAVAEEVRRILGDVDHKHIIVLVGPGNNGGDGLVTARHLHDWGAVVSVYLFGQRPTEDSNLKLVQKRGIACIEANQDGSPDKLNELLSSTDAVIDALFGTGKVRPLHDTFSQALDMVSIAKDKQPGLRIFALDLPSGLNADTGSVDPACLYADNTFTLGFFKPGLFNLEQFDPAGFIEFSLGFYADDLNNGYL